MKKGVLLFLILIFSINLVFAANYECSDGSLVIKNQKEIDLKNTKIINGISLGVSRSDETAAIERYSADLIIDAHKFSLTNETSSLELEFKTGKKTIGLNNLTGSIVNIDVGGTSGDVEKGDTATIGSFRVFLANAEGTYPGIATVDGIVGTDKIDLTSDEPNKIISLDSIEYALELFSASDTNTIIIVSKCTNDTAKITEIVVEVIENSTMENSTVENSTTTNLTLSNESIEDKTETTNISQEAQNNTQIESADSRLGGISTYTIIIISISILILIFVFFLIKHLRSKNIGGEEISSEEMNESRNF